MAMREGEECVQDFLGHLSCKKAPRHFVLEEEADDNDSFVDIMSGTLQSAMLSRKVGLLRMRWHLRIYQWRRWQRVSLTHLVCLIVGSFFITH